MKDMVDLDDLWNEVKDNIPSFERNCLTCGKPLALKTARDLTRKKFCSQSCNAANTSKENPINLREPKSKLCALCGTEFFSHWPKQIFCGKKCQNVSTDRAYKKRHGTLDWMLHRLAKRQDVGRNLDWEYLKFLYESQKGRCALSGVPMTHEVGKGRVYTNISIDRIDPSRGYEEGNIQLVCVIVNIMKSGMSVEALINWCRLIAKESHNASSQ